MLSTTHATPLLAFQEKHGVLDPVAQAAANTRRHGGAPGHARAAGGGTKVDCSTT